MILTSRIEQTADAIYFKLKNLLKSNSPGLAGGLISCGCPAQESYLQNERSLP